MVRRLLGDMVSFSEGRGFGERSLGVRVGSTGVSDGDFGFALRLILGFVLSPRAIRELEKRLVGTIGNVESIRLGVGCASSTRERVPIGTRFRGGRGPRRRGSFEKGEEESGCAPIGKGVIVKADSIGKRRVPLKSMASRDNRITITNRIFGDRYQAIERGAGLTDVCVASGIADLYVGTFIPSRG